MPSAPRSGNAALLLLLVLGTGFAAFAALVAAAYGGTAARDRASDRVLLEARAALVAHAVDRPIDLLVGPGYLPCPDLDGDGWAEATCGSLAGDSGQAQRLGLLPWKTLGLPELRDGHGERLWYAVATKYKGLLNCGASAACVDLTPAAAVGTITVREPTGAVRHDGTLADPRLERSGAVAVVIAPGPPLARADGTPQRRGCAPLPCAARDYLEALAGVEDNDAFVDRNDARRAENRDGFIAGPVLDAFGTPQVNDRIVAITYADLMPRIMARVALEAAHCMKLAAARDGAPPAPEPACGQAAWGRVPVPQPAIEACMLGPPDAAGWWHAWRPYVAYAPAPACGAPGACIALADAEGRVVAEGHRFALEVMAQPGNCTPPRLRCDGTRCDRVTQGAGLDVTLAVR